MSRRARTARRLALVPAPAPRPPTPIDTDALIARIENGELDSELTALHDAIAQRLHTLDTIQTANALLSFQIGDRVQLNCNARPNYLHGAPATVTGLNRQHVNVKLDQPIGRFHTGQLRCPPLILNKLAAKRPE
jgi:hypothetical protein